MKTARESKDIPQGEHYVVLTWESCKPARYPEPEYRPENYAVYDVFLDQREWQNRITELVTSRTPFAALVAKPASVTTIVQVKLLP